MSLLDLVLNSLQDDKAEDIVTIDLKGKSSIADHMVVASGRSTRQVAAITEKLHSRIKDTTGYISKIEGKGEICRIANFGKLFTVIVRIGPHKSFNLIVSFGCEWF